MYSLQSDYKRHKASHLMCHSWGMLADLRRKYIVPWRWRQMVNIYEATRCQIQNDSNIPCHGHDILETLVKSVSVKRLKFIDDFINLVSGFNCILCWSYFNVHAWIVHWSVRQSDGIFNAWYVHSLKAEILCYKLRRLGYKYISFDGLQVWNFHLTQNFIP